MKVRFSKIGRIVGFKNMRRVRQTNKASQIFISLIIFLMAVISPYGQDTNLPPDSVKISGVYYQIKPPWLGKRIGTEENPIPDNLSMIPRQYAYDSCRIFVTTETKTAFVSMVERANKDGIFFKIKSGFRSYPYQRQIFAARMAKGRSFDQVCRNVAPPGFSEHMQGTAMDLAADTVPFAYSDAYKWLKANAHNYGFVESYPEDMKDGFSWEAWHWNYVGGAKDTIE